MVAAQQVTTDEDAARATPAASRPSLHDSAELLASVYRRLEKRPAGKKLIPLQDQSGSFIGKAPEMRPALVLLKGATDLAGAEAEYSEAYRVVTIAVQDAALNAAFFDAFPRQVAALNDLSNRLRRTGIPERLHDIAEAVERRLSGLTPSDEDESKAAAKTKAVNPAGERLPPQADPHYASYVQEEFRGRVKAALAAEYAASFREPVAARRSRPTKTGEPTPDPRVATRQAWDLCKVLSLHPKFIDILTAYSAGADKGTELARALVDEAVAATRLFNAKLRQNPEHVWRYPPLLMLGIKRLGLGHVDLFPEYICDAAVAISHSPLTDVLTALGVVIFLIGLVLSGPLAPLELEAALTGVAFADLTVTSTQLAFTAIDEYEQDLAAVGGGLQPSSKKIVERGDYTGTLLNVVAALMCGIAFVFGGARLLRNWRTPSPRGARLRAPINYTGYPNRMLNRGIERSRFPDRTFRPSPNFRRPDPDLDPARRMAVGAPPPEEPLAAVSQDRLWLARPKSGRPTNDLAPIASSGQTPKSGAGSPVSGAAKNVFGSPATAPGSKSAGSKATASKANIAKGKPASQLTAKELDDAAFQHEWAENYWGQLKSLEKKAFAHSDAAGPSSSGPGRYKVLKDFPSRAAPSGQSTSEYYVKRYEELSGTKPPGGNDTALPGDEFATHAEIKDRISQIEKGKNGPTGVSLDMCPACRRWHQRAAALQKERFVVDDGSFTRSFNADGSVDIYDQSKQLIRKVPAGVPPQAKSDSYYGVDW